MAINEIITDRDQIHDQIYGQLADRLSTQLPQVGEPAGACGCGCCGPEETAAPTRGEEIAELRRLRDQIDERLTELEAR